MVSFAFGTVARISSIAASPLARLRIAMTTSAPAADSRRAKPNPRPLLDPVTTASFPDRSGTVATRLVAMSITPSIGASLACVFARSSVAHSDTLRE